MKIIKKTIIFLSVAGVKANKNEGPGRSRNRQKKGGGEAAPQHCIYRGKYETKFKIIY